MSMESIAPVRNLSARAIRDRLMKPPGGRDSSEIEVVPEYVAQLAKVEAEQRRNGELRIARQRHAQNLMIEFGRSLEKWIAEAGSAPAAPRLPQLTVSQILDAVADYYEVSAADIMSPSRKARFVRPRRILIYLAREHTECSLEMIAARIGGRDHTTVHAGHEAIATMVRQADPVTVKDIAAIRAILGAAPA